MAFKNTFRKFQSLKKGDRVILLDRTKGRVTQVRRVHDVYLSEEEFNWYKEIYGFRGLSWKGNQIMTFYLFRSNRHCIEEYFIYKIKEVLR